MNTRAAVKFSMNILTLSNCPLVESQGSGYVIVNFCRMLREMGHTVDVLGPEALEPFKYLKRGVTFRMALEMLYAALSRLSRKRYDVVEFYGGESWLAATVLSKIPRRSFLMVSHSNGIEPQVFECMERGCASSAAQPSALHKLHLYAHAFTKVDGLVTVSEFDRQYAFLKKYKDANHIVTINNSLPDSYLGLPVDFARSEAIGYCGSWLPIKGSEVIAAAISQILREFPKVTFIIAGVGTDFQKESHFPADVLNRIVIVEEASRDELQCFYQSVSILIKPSIYESFGLAMAEAMACGCAIVSTRTGYAVSLIPNVEAVIIDRPESTCLYDGIKVLLKNKNMRVKIAMAGYKRVQELRWDNAVRLLEGTYSTWLEEFRHR